MMYYGFVPDDGRYRLVRCYKADQRSKSRKVATFEQAPERCLSLNRLLTRRAA